MKPARSTDTEPAGYAGACHRAAPCADPLLTPLTVIASSAKQSRARTKMTVDCFVACAPRNDDTARFVETIQSDASSPVLSAKYFCSRLTQIKSISPPSRPKQGAYRDRHGRGAGCDGRGSVRRAHGARTNGAVPPSAKLRRTGTRPVEGFGVDGSRTAKSCGPDAPTLVSSFAEQSAQRRWQKSPVTGESTK